jgi:hypothetical protein
MFSRTLNRTIVLFAGVVPALIWCGSAQAFSLGLRPYLGSEIVTLPGTKLFDADGTQRTLDVKDVSKNFVYFGGEIAATPVELGALSVSLLAGFRMMSSTSAPSATAPIGDALKLSYLPLGASVDFAISKIRSSGYFSYDLGVGPSFILNVASPANSANLQMSKLSRMRFGALAEFFVMPSLSVFGNFDFSTGSFQLGAQTLSFASDGSDNVLQLSTQAGVNKLSALSFGGGVAYYIPVPASQRPATGKDTESKEPASKKKPAGKGTAPAKKGKTKGKAPAKVKP